MARKKPPKPEHLSKVETSLLKDLASKRGVTFEEAKEHYLVCINDPDLKKMGFENEGQIIEFVLNAVISRLDYAKHFDKTQEVESTD
jgi:hypothetical protein